MKIGITFDLRSAYLAMGFSEDETAEFDRDDTIQAIENTLRELGHETERVGHIKELAAALVAGKRWDLVFNIAEGMYGIGREAQVPALLDAYRIPYTFSDPLVMSLTLDKGMTKRVVRDAGVPTSDFFVAATADDAVKVRFAPPFFVKPVAEGTGKGITPASIVRERDSLAARVADLLQIYKQPVLVEPYLSGREFTVAIVGTGEAARTIGSMEVILLSNAEQGVYSYVNKEKCEELVEYRLVGPSDDPVVAESERIAMDAWRVLGCRDAGRIDIRCDSGNRPQFMEVNPLAGIHPEHSDLPIICNKVGLSYRDLLKAIVDSASVRVGSGVAG
ncbi:MAG TPA: D-alanine--D-alanine ligase [Desulfobulbaceae bacterium]|nr:D-alanine--D-alanine ligase [Desulfobulbaceae bacterium]